MKPTSTLAVDETIKLYMWLCVQEHAYFLGLNTQEHAYLNLRVKSFFFDPKLLTQVL